MSRRLHQQASHQALAKPSRYNRWLAVRSIVAVAGVFCIAMLGVAFANAANRETLAQFEAVRRVGGRVRFDSLRSPEWIAWLFGCHASQIHLPNADVTDAWVATHLRSTRDLFFLDVSYTQVSDIAQSGIDSMKNLRVLDLSGTQVSDAGIETLRQNIELRTLSLSNTGIGDSAIEHFSELSELSTLRLDNTRTTDAGINHIAQLPNIRIVSLRGTKISDVGLSFLNHTSTLVQLDVRDTGVTRAGVLDFVRRSGYMLSHDLSADLQPGTVTSTQRKPIQILLNADEHEG